VSQGFGERPGESKIERRDGSRGIMNRTHISTPIGISPQISRKERTVGNAGPGRDKNGRKLLAGNSYVPNTPPLREISSHANSRSKSTVKIFPHTRKLHTEPPSKPIGGRPLLAGASPNALPAKVLASPSEFGSRARRSNRRKSYPRTPNVARGASASREKSVGYYEAVAKFCKDSEKGLEPDEGLSPKD
jgi:hypothetical protein